MALTDNLVSHWKLNEASGTRADSHGSNDLTDFNTVTSETGKLGDASSHNQANNEYLTSTAAGLNLSDRDITVAGWFKIATGASSDGYIFMPGGGTAWAFRYLTGPSIRVYFGGSLRHTVSFSALDTWFFLVGTYNAATDTLKTYINGTEVGSTSSILGTTSSTFGIGGIGGNADSTMAADSVSFWDRVLTTEISDLYNSGDGLDYEGFAGGTTFNESGDLSAIPSLTSSETLTLSESGTLSAIPTLTGDQTVSLSGVGDLSAIPSLTADQTIAVNESGDLYGIPSLTGDVANAFDESATLSGIPSLTGDHTYTLQGGSTLSAVPSLTADQTVTMNLSGELSAIPSLTGVDTGLAGVTAFNGGGRSEFVGPPARSSQFRSGRNNVSEFRTGRWVN